MDLKKEMKNEAIARMKKLNIMPRVINDFRRSGRVYYSERQNSVYNAVLYWLDNEPEYVELVKRFEKEFGGLVYHAQLTHTIDGDMLSLLYVTKHKDEWAMDNEDIKDGIVLAYVNGEIGNIQVKPSMGGIVRVA